MYRVYYILTVSCLLFNLSHAQSRPNILWLVIEDTSPDFIGCYGNSFAKTPAIDQLAAGGIQFANAFSTNTVCAPTRSCIITGVRSNQLGTGNHRSEYHIPDSIHGFPTYLRQAGYYTSNNRKTDYNTADEKRLIEESWYESSEKAGWWKRSPGQPFFAIFNFMESHESRTMQVPYEQYKKIVLDQLPGERKIEADELPLPSYYSDNKEVRKQFARIYNSISLADLRIQEILQRLDKEGLRDSTIIFFYADHGEAMPRGKTNGIDRGYRVPFVIWFPPMYAHLSPWGKPGTITNELVDFEDLAPTVISLAHGKVPAYMHGRILTGDTRSTPVDHILLTQDRGGESLDLVRSVSNGRYIYSRNYLNFMPESRLMKYHESAEISQIRRQYFDSGQASKEQSIDFVARPAEYLFDTKNDQWETNNLADQPAYKTLLHQMRAKLDSFILASRDIQFIPEYEMNEIDQHQPMYDYRQSATNYPLKEIYTAATLSGFQGPGILKQQITFLKNKNKVIRYWGVMGLRNQQILPTTVINALDNSITDPYPPVQILAAAICYDHNLSAKARSTLEKSLLSSNKYLQLEALQMVTYMNHGKDFIDVVKQVLKDAPKEVESVAYAAECYLYKFNNLSLN